MAEGQRILKERMHLKQGFNEITLINELKAMGITEGAAARAMSLLIGNGEVERLRGRLVQRIK